MSWSTSAIGKPAAVAAQVEKTLSNIKCMEPEETIKNTIKGILATALAAFPPNMAVKVDANGSQSVPDSATPTVTTNSLYVKIEPLYGFVE